MNTVSTLGQTQAMDGRSVYNSLSVQKMHNSSKVPQDNDTIPKSAAEVSENISKNLEATKASAQELQRLSDMISGHKLQFNVNDELGKIVVKVVDKSTNEIIREIPSEDVQRIQIRMRQAIGVLFDEVV